MHVILRAPSIKFAVFTDGGLNWKWQDTLEIAEMEYFSIPGYQIFGIGI